MHCHLCGVQGCSVIRVCARSVCPPRRRRAELPSTRGVCSLPRRLPTTQPVQSSNSTSQFSFCTCRSISRICRARSSAVRRRSRTGNAATKTSSERSCLPYRSCSRPEAASAAADTTRCRMRSMSRRASASVMLASPSGAAVFVRLISSDEDLQAVQDLLEFDEERRGVLRRRLALLMTRIREDARLEVLHPTRQIATFGQCLSQLHGYLLSRSRCRASQIGDHEVPVRG